MSEGSTRWSKTFVYEIILGCSNGLFHIIILEIGVYHY
jgi:hypothetical protein